MLPLVADNAVGASGTARGVAVAILDGTLVPTSLTADTLKE